MHSIISEHYEGSYARTMTELFGTLSEVHKKLADTCNQLKEVVKANDDYLKRYRDELVLKNELFKEWQERYVKFHTAARKLQDKGSELLKKTPFDQWEIPKSCPYNKEELEINKSLVFPYLDCAEAKELEASKDMYGYFANRIAEEFSQLWVETQKEFIKHFGGISKTNADIFSKVTFPL